VDEEESELHAEKLSAPLLVPEALLRDCQLNIAEWLTANPHLRPRPAPRVLTRREKFRKRVTAVRLALAERAFKRISGQDPADVYWEG
jgi:hypothetical protein